jgi:MraZ protein
MELKTGSAESTLDDKGRVSIPVRFREHYQGELVITRGTDHCIWIMTGTVWEHFEQTLRSSEVFTQEERFALEDIHLNEAEKEELDKAGRIAIPPRIRRYANLSKDCTIVSAENRLAIWDSAAYDAHIREQEPLARLALNKFGSRGIFKTD